VNRQMSVWRLAACWGLLGWVLTGIGVSQGIQAARRPPNVVVVVVDGMGPGMVVASRYTKGGPSHRLALDGFPVVGWVTTYSANNGVTDSAAAGTALACGIKTNNGYVGVNPRGEPCETLLDVANAMGYRTAIITNTSMVDATPAAFYAHVSNRRDSKSVAAWMASANIDLMVGGGSEWLVTANGVVSSWRTRGGQVTTNWGDESMGFPLLALLQPGDFSYEWETPTRSFEAVVTRSMSHLVAKGEPFVAVIESGLVDKAAHRNWLRYAMAEMDTLDRLIPFLRQIPNTLLVLTADHDTGGLAINGYREWAHYTGAALWEGTTRQRVVTWASGPDMVIRSKGMGVTESDLEVTDIADKAQHTAMDVPLYASGPFSAWFAGILDNTQVFDRLRKVVTQPAVGPWADR